MLQSLRRSNRYLGREPFTMTIDGRAYRRRKTRPEERLPAHDDEHARLLRVPSRLAHSIQVTASHAVAADRSFFLWPRTLIFQHVLRFRVQPVRRRIDPFDVF